MRLGKIDFKTQPLQPFGELWTPESGTTAMEDLLVNPDVLAQVVDRVQNSGLAVIGDTTVGKNWLPVYEDPRDDLGQIAHVDRGPYSDPVTLHMLHSKEGRSTGTAYVRRPDLTASAKANIQVLREAVNGTTEDIREKYRLAELLEHYEHPEGGYSFNFFDPVQRMRDDMARMQGQMSGMEWHAGQNIVQIRADFPQVAEAYRALLDFYRQTSVGSVHYENIWTPGTTVLAYQDPEKEFATDDDRVFHFRNGESDYTDQRFLHRDLVLRVESRRGTYYEAYSQILARQSIR